MSIRRTKQIPRLSLNMRNRRNLVIGAVVVRVPSHNPQRPLALAEGTPHICGPPTPGQGNKRQTTLVETLHERTNWGQPSITLILAGRIALSFGKGRCRSCGLNN
jgi:hypothetical protein